MTDQCFDQNRRDDTDSGFLPAVLWEVDMVQATIRRFGAIRALVLVGLLGIGLIASTAVPDVGSSNTWTPTGSMANARTHHTATLLANGEVLWPTTRSRKVLSRSRGARSKRALGMEASEQARWFERLSSEPRNATLIRRAAHERA
jgi:hypothetical protein